MRFRLVLRVERDEGMLLPLNYQYELSSWIYHVLNRNDGHFASWLHEQGYCAGSKSFKLFTFSHLQVPAYRIEGDRMEIRCDRIVLFVSFYPMGVDASFIAEAFRHCAFVLGDRKSRVKFFVEEVACCPEVEFTREMAFRALSPIFMDERVGKRKNPTRHVVPGDDIFETLLNTNLLDKYWVIHQQLPPEDWAPLRFRLLDAPKLKVIAIKQSTPQATKLCGYLCRFVLSGEPELLAIAYHVGLGRLNSQGFGCIEVLGEQKKLST